MAFCIVIVIVVFKDPLKVYFPAFLFNAAFTPQEIPQWVKKLHLGYKVAHIYFNTLACCFVIFLGFTWQHLPGLYDFSGEISIMNFGSSPNPDGGEIKVTGLQSSRNASCVRPGFCICHYFVGRHRKCWLPRYFSNLFGFFFLRTCF